MTAKRFYEAKRLYNSALELEPAQREAYLADACRGDEALRKEVESLLGCRTAAKDFFDTPMVQPDAQESASDLTGHTLSHFEIIEKIGEGGMGVVYKARDTHLDRIIALKVLPSEKVADPERKRRFVQEAKAASALNHPNIVTIHDIDTADSVTFIAMEFVKGRTLESLIRGKGVSLKETLKHGVQVADALAAAHAAGIVHRDIKPANIMITESGLVKVLDFGLAKLTETSVSIGANAPGAKGQTTQPGVILGTVSYMSPEQAQGKEVDTRSDIFSFGSVLYEMATGRRAFSGETNVSTLAAILRDEPKPVSQLARETPGELEMVIGRCLRKDPAWRFQYMANVKAALEELKEKSDSGAPVRAVPGMRRHGWIAWAAGALAAAALGLGAWFGLLRPADRPAAKIRAFTALPGIQTGPALSPDGKQVVFVWNGEKQDNFDIYVQLVGETTPRRLTSEPAFEYSPVWSPDALHIAFLRETPAGTEVIVIPAAGGAEKRVHVSSAGCTWWDSWAHAREFCGISWSPNGKLLTIVDRESPQAANSIYLLDIETRETHKLTAPPRGFEDGLSVFSPDGRSLAFARRPNLPLSDIYILPLSESGQPRAEPKRITHDNAFILGFDWTRDGRDLVFSSSRGGVDGLWRVSSAGGRPERLAVSSNDAAWPSIARTGDRLVYAFGTLENHVWRMAAPGSGVTGPEAAPLRITRSPRVDQQPTFSPDGQKIAWSSMHSGEHQIWVCGADGSLPAKLTEFGIPGADAPQWSPDGRYIAFRGFSPWPPRVYVIGAEGGAARRLTAGDFTEDPPGWSRDGKWIYFTSDRGGGNGLWKAPVSGGSPVLVARQGSLPVAEFHISRGIAQAHPQPKQGSLPAVESSDGRFVYYEGPGATVWKIPSGGGSPILLARSGGEPFFESGDGNLLYFSGPDASIGKVPTTGGEQTLVLKTGRRAKWTFTKAGFYILDPDAKGGPAIEFVPSAGKGSRAVTLPGQPDNYVTSSSASVAASPDGRWIIYLYDDRSDVQIMLVENFR